MWTKEESSVQVVERAWDTQVEGSHCFKLARKLKWVKHELREWNKDFFGNVKARIKALESRIEEVRGLEPNKDNLELEAALCLELEEWLEKDELKWEQN